MDTYNQSLTINQSYAPTWISIGNLYLNQKNYNSARAAYNKAILINPENLEAINGGKLIEEKLSKDSTEIEELLRKYKNAFNLNDFNAISSLLTSDSYHIENGELKIMSQNVLSGVSLRLKIKDIIIKNLSIDNNKATTKTEIIYISGVYIAPKYKDIELNYENGKWLLTNIIY